MEIIPCSSNLDFPTSSSNICNDITNLIAKQVF